MKAAAVDMTKGNEIGLIIRFSLPLLAGNLLQQLYNVVDTAIVGKTLGDDALAAVGATGSVTFLFYTLCLGLATGSGIMIAQFFGAGFLQRMRSAVWNSALVTLFLGIGISIVSVILAESVLRMMDTEPQLIHMSVQYMKIACGGTVAVAAYNWINAVMRSLGDSRTPLLFLGVSSVLNILLDFLFILTFHMGVSGAAFATVLSQCISAAGCILFAFRRMPELKFTPADLQVDFRMILLCFRTGLPIALQSGLIAISMVILQKVTNGYGKTVMTAYTASTRIEQLVHQPFMSLNTALSTFAGQNIGAGQTERAQKGLISGLKISTALALAMLVFFQLFGGFMIRIFISGSSSVAIGKLALRITSLFYIPLGFIYLVRGFLNGAGDTFYALLNGLTEVFCRIFGAIIMAKLFHWDYMSIWYTTGLTWTVTGLVGWIRYKSDVWKSKSLSA